MDPVGIFASVYQKWFTGSPMFGFVVVSLVLSFVVVGPVWYLAIERVKSEQQQEKLQESEALGNFMTQGTHLYIASQKEQSVLAAYLNWEQRLSQFLDRSLNHSYSSRLNTAGTDRLVPQVRNPENQIVIGMTTRYRSAIDEFIREIGTSTFSTPIKLDADTLKLVDRKEFDLLLNPPAPQEAKKEK